MQSFGSLCGTFRCSVEEGGVMTVYIVTETMNCAKRVGRKYVRMTTKDKQVPHTARGLFSTEKSDF